MRTAVLAAAVLFCVVFGFLTLVVLFTNGPDVLSVLSLIVLGVVGFGIVGALREDDR